MDLKAYCSIIRVSTPYTPYIVAFLKITTVIFPQKSPQTRITKPFSENFKFFYAQIITLFCGTSAYISQIYMQILHKPPLLLHTPLTLATRKRFYRIGILCKYPIRYYHTLAFLSIFNEHPFKQAPCGASEGRALLRRGKRLAYSLRSRSRLLAASALIFERV